MEKKSKPCDRRRKFDLPYRLMQFLYTFLDFADHCSLQQTGPRWHWQGTKPNSWAPGLTFKDRVEVIHAFNQGCRNLVSVTCHSSSPWVVLYGNEPRTNNNKQWTNLRSLCCVNTCDSQDHRHYFDFDDHLVGSHLTTLHIGRGWYFPANKLPSLPPTLTNLTVTLRHEYSDPVWSEDVLPNLRHVHLAYYCPNRWTACWAAEALPCRHKHLESIHVHMHGLELVDNTLNFNTVDWATQSLTSLSISSSNPSDLMVSEFMFGDLLHQNNGLVKLAFPDKNIDQILSRILNPWFLTKQIETLYMEEDRKTSCINIALFLDQAVHLRVLELGNSDKTRNFGTASVIATLVKKRPVQLVPCNQRVALQPNVLQIVYIP